MIKKFNEDWDTFQDINVNKAPTNWSPEQKKSGDLMGHLNVKNIEPEEPEMDYFISSYANSHNITFEEAEEILREKGVDTSYGPPKKRDYKVGDIVKILKKYPKDRISLEGGIGEIKEITKNGKYFIQVTKTNGKKGHLTSGGDEFNSNEFELSDLKTIPNVVTRKEEIKFDTINHDVVGLPSGQIVYMNNTQIKFFKARGLIGFKTIWKKPTTSGMTPINLGKYCFEDPLLPNIKDFIETITW